MKSLIQFILKYHFLILFLIIETLCFITIYNQNYYQHSKILHSANSSTAIFLKAYNNTTDYFKLNHINNQLLEENARLLGYKKNAYIVYIDDTIYLDSTKTQQRYNYVAAKVIGSSINKPNNFITIDKGSNDGIEEGFAVIGRNNNVIGKVIRVSRNFSVIASVLNKKVKISAKLQKNNYVGTAFWEGESAEFCTFRDIPTHINLEKGDSIITSGYSFVFPEGILLGTIENYEVFEGKDFYNINVRLSTNFQSLEYVYVAIDKYKNELDEIKPTNEEMNEQ